MDMYTFNHKNISSVDPSIDADLADIDAQILDIENQYSLATDEDRKLLREKKQALKQEKEKRKWQAYITFLRTKNTTLADVFAQLVESNFDFSVLSADQQQTLVDVLVTNKLEDSIKNKIPELLSVKEEKITQFVHDLFDLKKMDITIPTKKNGNVSLTFLKKEFMASVHKELP
jgi:hypothetical protein